jgi:hypothetical protein
MDLLQGETLLSSIPEADFTVATGLTRTVFGNLGLAKDFDRWSRGVYESIGAAYIVALNEVWEGFDAERGRELLDAALVAALHEIYGRSLDQDEVDSVPRYSRVELGLRGLGSAIPTYQPFREYVQGQPAYERIQGARPLHTQISAELDRRPRRKTEVYETLLRYGWETGSHLGVLYLLGETEGAVAAVELSGRHC